MALSYAKSQHEATRRAVDAWACLRDGFVGSNIIPSTLTRRAASRHHQQIQKTTTDLLIEEPEGHATIFNHSSNECANATLTIVAVDHELLKLAPLGSTSADVAGDNISAFPTAEADTILPLVVADPIPEGDEDVGDSRILDPFGFGSSNVLSQSRECGASASAIAHSVPVDSAAPVTAHRDLSDSKGEDREEDEAMTSSMQSLVNGLMTWGGDNVEVDFTLPAGMAASIAMEESGVFGNKGTKIS